MKHTHRVVYEGREETLHWAVNFEDSTLVIKYPSMDGSSSLMFTFEKAYAYTGDEGELIVEFENKTVSALAWNTGEDALTLQIFFMEPHAKAMYFYDFYEVRKEDMDMFYALWTYVYDLGDTNDE